MSDRRVLALGICLIVWLSSGAACRQATAIGEGVVSAERVQLKQSTARVPGFAGELRRGDKVTIIGEQGNMQKVRCEQPKQIEGWMEKRDIVSQDLFSKGKSLENSTKGIPAQATGKVKQDSNLRLIPSRDTDGAILFQVPRETHFDILDKKHVLSPKGKDKDADKPQKMEAWYEVRLPQDFLTRVGWVYGPSVEFAIPTEIATYENSGYKFVAWHVIGSAKDKESGEVKNYLILEKRIGNNDSSVDFDRIYAVAWDPEGHSYYSIMAVSDLKGKTPLSVETDKEGRSTATMTLLDRDGKPVEAKYEISKDDKGKYRMVRVDNNDTSKAKGKKK